MNQRESFEASEQKRQIIAERQVCEFCGEPGTQLAHRIINSAANIRNYGKAIIHHPLNTALVCGLKCNAKANIEHDPLEKWRLLKQIQKELEHEEDHTILGRR